MLSRQPRRIVGLSAAFDKSPSRVQQIVDNAPAASWYCTDGWSGYTDVVYPGHHQRNVHDNSDTFTVEGVNADLRHCIPLLARRSRCFAADDGNTVRCHRGVYGGLQPLWNGQAPTPPDPRKGSLPLGLGRLPLISAFGHSRFEYVVALGRKAWYNSFAFPASRCDGIGRRSGLKIHRQQWRAGSSPAIGTKSGARYG